MRTAETSTVAAQSRVAFSRGVVLATVLALIAAYAGVARLLIFHWYNNDVYSYGFLIPLISAYMLWLQRGPLAAGVGAPDWLLGLPLLVLGLGSLLIGRAGGFGVLQELSVVPSLAGIVALYWGRHIAWRVSFPLLYLLLALPVWDVVTNPLHEPFQLLSARIGETLLGLMAVPTYRDATRLHLPTVSLEVARVCSGVNYLISVVAIAIPYTYLALSRVGRRIAVIAFAVVVAILSNGLRVALIGALQYYGLSDEADLHGPNHMLQGMFVAVIGYLALFGAGWMLRDREAARPRELGSSRPAAPAHGVNGLPAVLVLGLLGCAALLVPRIEPQPVLADDRAWWPALVGEWQRDDGSLEGVPIRAARPDAEFSRAYRSRQGRIDVYIGYFAVQVEGRKVMGFGGARLPQSALQVEVRRADGDRFTAAFGEAPVPSGDTRYVLAWYDLGGAIASDEYRAKLKTLWNSVVHRRSNGAVVSLALDAGSQLDAEAARTILQEFASQFLAATRPLSGDASR